jgi:predicted ATPase
MLDEAELKMQNNFIRSIQLENYKSIKSADIELTNLNVLIGANGAGKSNLISLFMFLNNLLVGNLQNYVLDRGGVDGFLHYGRKSSKTLSLAIQLMDYDGGLGSAEQFKYWANLVPTDKDIFRFSEEGFSAEGIEHDLDWVSTSYESMLETIATSTYGKNIEDGPDDLLPNDWWLANAVINNYGHNQVGVFHFHDTGNSSPIKNTIANNDNLFLRGDGGNIAGMIKRIHDEYPPFYQMIIDIVRQVVPDFHNFVIRNNEFISLEWFNKNSIDIPWKAHYLSDGSLRFICLAVLLLMPSELQPLTIIIDEPELGLHPSAITVLSGLIKRAAHERQVIISTQSPTLLTNFALEDIIVVDKKDKASEFRRLNQNELSQWLDEFSLSQMWEMNLLGGRP